MSPGSTSGFRVGKLHFRPERWGGRDVILSTADERWPFRSEDHKTMGKYFSFHDYTFLPSINNWREQLRIDKKEDNKILVKGFYPWRFWFERYIGRVIRWQQSLRHLSRCGFRGNILSNHLPNGGSGHPAHSVCCTITPLFETEGWSLAPSTRIAVKTTQSQTHFHSGISMCKYTHRPTLLDPLLNPLPTTVQRDLWET